MIITGLGLGVTLPIFTLVVQNAFDHSKLGVVTASTQLFRSIGGTVGTAVFGSVLNNALASKFGDLSSDKFVQIASQANPNFDLTTIDANKLAGILTGPGRAQIEKQLSQLPPFVQPQAQTAFSEFVTKAKDAFASSVVEVFLIGAVVMAVAFLVAFLLREIPLKTTHEGVGGSAEEAGKELATEEAIVLPAEDEPQLEEKTG